MSSNIKNHKSLYFKFGILFFAIAVVTLLVSGIATYSNQAKTYQQQQEETLEHTAEYLSAILQNEGYEFSAYQNYFLAHFREMNIPLDFTDEDMQEARETYLTLFTKENPGKVLGKDIFLEELSPEVQQAFALYKHEYYLLLFEKAKELFGLTFFYYMVPTGEPYHLVYVLDGIREPKVVGDTVCINLGVDAFAEPDEHKMMWAAWNTGKAPGGCDVYNSEYGKTLAWYVPLYVNGNKTGLIGSEVSSANFNRTILANTFRQLASLIAVLVVGVILMLYFINRFFIKKIRLLTNDLENYASDKDVRIVKAIEDDLKGEDELAELGKQTSSMIIELDNYMKSLVKTTRELSHTKKDVDAMEKLANKDALTGVRNRHAYTECLDEIERKLSDKEYRFGLAVVDLNFLKQTNDTYGHEQGNIMIIRCCRLVCSVFKHSPVFRIGGDEFVVILENEDLNNVDQLILQMNEKMLEMKEDSSLEPWEKVSAAIGYAVYDPEDDSDISSVFKRADKAMYLRKAEMKQK